MLALAILGESRSMFSWTFVHVIFIIIMFIIVVMSKFNKFFFFFGGGWGVGGGEGNTILEEAKALPYMHP